MKEYPKEYLIEHKVTYQMGYKAFRNEILSQVQDGLKEKGDYICSSTVQKNGIVQREGLQIRRRGKEVSTNIYYDDLYENYLKGQPLSEAVSQVVELEPEKRFPDITVTDLKDYRKMKERLRIRLISRKGNEGFLEEVPYQVHPMGVVSVYAKFEEKNGGAAGMHITHLIRDVWGISEMELFETALENSQKKEEIQFHSLEEEMDHLMGRERTENEAPDPNRLYILSNHSKQFGASVLLYPGVLESVRKKLGGDYFILPSSVHEVLVLSKESDIPPEVLKSTVKTVNWREVRPKERLANEIYEYCGGSSILKKCRIQEREMAL